MGKEVTFKNRDKLIHLGVMIASLRRLRGWSQDTLAEKAGISRSHMSAIEAPGMAENFTMDTFLNIADALSVEPSELLKASVIPEKLL